MRTLEEKRAAAEKLAYKHIKTLYTKDLCISIGDAMNICYLLDGDIYRTCQIVELVKCELEREYYLARYSQRQRDSQDRLAFADFVNRKEQESVKQLIKRQTQRKPISLL